MARKKKVTKYTAPSGKPKHAGRYPQDPHARTFSEEGSKREARQLRKSGYDVSRYKLKSGPKKGRYRVSIRAKKK